MDNASSNDTTMREIERHLHERDIDFNAADRKVMCFGHVIDLSSGRVIDAFTKARQLADENEDWSAPPAPNVLGRHMKRRSHVTPSLSVELLSESYEHQVCVEMHLMMLSQTGMRKGGLDAVMISSESTRYNCCEMFARAGTWFTTCSISFGCCNR
jgi:hypothetical protein